MKKEPEKLVTVAVPKAEKPPRKRKQKVDKTDDVEYDKNIKDSIYNFIMKDDFGIKTTDKPKKME